MPKYYAVTLESGIYNRGTNVKVKLQNFQVLNIRNLLIKKWQEDFMKEFFVESKPTPKTTFLKKTVN